MNFTERRQIIFVMLLFLAACSSKAPDKQADKPADAPTATQPSNSAQPPTASSDHQAPVPIAQSSPAETVATPEPPPAPPPPVVIPAGTVLSVRLRQALGSKTSSEGDRFRAALTKPVVVDGTPVAAVGASASGSVTESHAAGRFKGGASLDIVLRSITIAGHSYPITTQPAALATQGKGKRTAGMVGGGGAGGALIGGVAGGGKGAAIGALVGAGAGTVGAGFTGNRDIDLPVNSALTFKMTKPLTLNSDFSN